MSFANPHTKMARERKWRETDRQRERRENTKKKPRKSDYIGKGEEFPIRGEDTRKFSESERKKEGVKKN